MILAISTEYSFSQVYLYSKLVEEWFIQPAQ